MPSQRPSTAAADERAPLLKPSEPLEPSLPWLQLGVLLLLRLNEPICMLALVPVSRRSATLCRLRRRSCTGERSAVGITYECELT